MIRLFAGTHIGDIAMQDNHQANLGGFGQDAVQRRVVQAGRMPRNLRRHDLLVNAELADAGKHAGERAQDALDVVGGVHVRRVEARNHGVHPLPLRVRQRQVLVRDHRIHKRIIVECSVRAQVIVRGPVSGHEIIPFLLQRNAEQRSAAYPVTHHVEIFAGCDPLLCIIQQVEMCIVEVRNRRAGFGNGRNCFVGEGGNGRCWVMDSFDNGRRGRYTCSPDIARRCKRRARRTAGQYKDDQTGQTRMDSFHGFGGVEHEEKRPP